MILDRVSHLFTSCALPNENPPCSLHSGIFAQNFIQIYTNPHMGMIGMFKEAERIKELEFVVKLHCFSAKVE